MCVHAPYASNAVAIDAAAAADVAEAEGAFGSQGERARDLLEVVEQGEMLPLPAAHDP